VSDKHNGEEWPVTEEAREPIWDLPPEGPQRQKNPWIGVALSFFIPGAGQAYNGEYGKAAIIFIAFVILLITIVCPIIIWAYGIYDAYTVAVKINRSGRLRKDSIGK
jgi:TM2 domain-containing membrane protein YozV